MNTPDLEELLELLEKKTEEKKAEKSESDSCKRFIQKNNVVKGLDRVPNYVIYYTYRKHYKAKLGEEKWSKVHFFRIFNKYFDQVRTGRQRYYELDGKTFDLTREGLLKAQKYDEEYKIKVKKARGTYKKRKRRKSVSLSEKES